jgi:heat-inducible transcriptional repressor
MASLTEAGMLHQPHTSAGRIPTENGYRYFVQRLVRDENLPAYERHLISHQFHQARASVGQWSSLAAAVLAHHAGGAALVTALHSEKARFKHMELVATRDLQVLIVLVLQSGQVLQQMLTLDEVIGQQYLSEMADRITHKCHDLGFDGLHTNADIADHLEAQVLDSVSVIMQQADTLVAGEVHLDGIENVLSEREFIESQNARQALHLLQEHTFLERFLTKALRPQIGGVQVVIAGDGGWSELQECSMVLARYGDADIATGALGVLGPTRMAYERAIGTVRYVAKLMTDLVCESYG